MAGLTGSPGCAGSGSMRSPTRRGHKYLTVVVDHDTGRLVWAAPGRDKATLGGSSTLLGAERLRPDHPRVGRRGGLDRRCGRPNAARTRSAARIPFHVVAWATEALDEVRRQAWNDARAWPAPSPAAAGAGPAHDAAPRPGHDRARRAQARPLRAVEEPGEPHRPPGRQARLDRQDRPRLHRAYLLKEGLRHVFAVKGDAGKRGPGPVAVLGPPLPHPRLRRAAGRIDPQTPGHDRRRPRARPVQRPDRIHQHQDPLLTRIAFGFASADALIALAMLALGGHRPALPGRTNDPRISQESQISTGVSDRPHNRRH